MKGDDKWFNYYQDVDDFLFGKLAEDFPTEEGSTQKNTIAAIEKYAERVHAVKLAKYIGSDEQAIRADERKKCADRVEKYIDDNGGMYNGGGWDEAITLDSAINAIMAGGE